MAQRIVHIPPDTLKVVDGSFDLMTASIFSQSSFTQVPRGSGQVLQTWKAKLSLVTEQSESDALDRWRAFVAELEGVTALFPLSDPIRHLPKGKAAGISFGVPRTDEILYEDSQGQSGSLARDLKVYRGSTLCYVAESASAKSDTVLLSDLLPSETVFLSGDRIEINRNLYQVQRDTRSSPDGLARVKIRPRLWRGVAARDMVKLCEASGLFRLESSGEGLMAFSSRGLASGTINAIGVPWRPDDAL